MQPPFSYAEMRTRGRTENFHDSETILITSEIPQNNKRKHFENSPNPTTKSKATCIH
jgi:hypothetical protein